MDQGPARFANKQSGVALGMTAALALTLGVFLVPAGRGIESSRLRAFALSSGLAALFLAIAVGRLARHRFFSARDIDGAGLIEASAEARSLQAVLQNTLEQTTLAVIAYGVALGLDPPASPRLIVLCALSFAAGRILFMIGYRRGAAARALGFGMTFYPTVGLYLLSLKGIAAGAASALAGG